MGEEKVITNPIKAIRAKCLNCCCGSVAEVTACEIKHCPLWPFRSGKNPYYKRKEYTEAEREKLAEQLARNVGRS